MYRESEGAYPRAPPGKSFRAIAVFHPLCPGCSSVRFADRPESRCGGPRKVGRRSDLIWVAFNPFENCTNRFYVNDAAIGLHSTFIL